MKRFANITHNYSGNPPTSIGQDHGLQWGRERDRAILMDAGWREITAPDTTETPDGMQRVASRWDQDPADPDGCIETRQFEDIPQPDPIPESVIAKYAAFATAYSEAIIAARAAGADISPDVSYENLIAALNQLPGDQWTRTAVGLSALWDALCIVAEHDRG